MLQVRKNSDTSLWAVDILTAGDHKSSVTGSGSAKMGAFDLFTQALGKKRGSSRVKL